MQARKLMLIPVVATLLLTFGIGLSNAAKIAVFNNFFTHSHSAFLTSLADVLSEHGHDVTVITAEVDTTINFPVPKKATHMVQLYTNQTAYQNPEMIKNAQGNLWTTSYDYLQKQRTIGLFRKRIEGQCERLLKNKDFVARVTAEKFDFALTEPMDFCGYGFMKLAGIPAYANSIPMAMAGMVARGLGLSGPLFEPFPIASGSNTEMSFFERVIDKVMPAYTVLLDGMDIRELSVSVVQKLVDPAFTAEEAIANGRYLFFNTEEHMDFPRPISHKVIYIGGITVAQSSADALPDDYKKIFDNAKHGVVYVSFGSIARSKFMPEHIKAAFLKTFKAFPEINFIWKYEDPSDDVAKDLPNVFKMAWVPQKEVLAHPRLLAFVTHGGMNSVLEAALTGVPLLGVPLFADQYRNVRMLEFRGTSVIIKKNDVTPKKLIAAIHTLTDTDDHRIRAREIASLARTKPLNATQRFISYINHAIAFSNTTDFLDINNRQMSTFKYFDLDVYAFLIGFAIFIVTVIVYAVFKVVSLIRSAILRVVSVDQKKTL